MEDFVLPPFDPSQKKKKKRRNRRKNEPEERPFMIHKPQPENIVDTPLDKVEKEENIQPPLDDQDSEYNFLLKRLYDQLRQNNEGLWRRLNPSTSDKNRLILPPPKIIHIGKTRTEWTNFSEILETIHRPFSHFVAYIMAEFKTKGGVNSENCLLLRGRFSDREIECILRKYIREYVLCRQCRSHSTLLTISNRILECTLCGSKVSVARI